MTRRNAGDKRTQPHERANDLDRGTHATDVSRTAASMMAPCSVNA
jgi:hypothetical protein